MATCRESGPEWDNEIKDDVTAECTKFGVVEHAFVDINSKVRGNGCIEVHRLQVDGVVLPYKAALVHGGQELLEVRTIVQTCALHNSIAWK